MIWIAMALALAPATSQGDAVAPDQLLSFDCDTPGGSSSHVKLSLPASTRSISGVLKMQEARFGTEWVPVVSVAALDAEGKGTRVQLISYKPRADLNLVVRDGGEARTVGTIKDGEDLPFRFAFGQDDRWTVELNGDEIQLGSRGTAVTLSLGCSSGNFDLGEVLVSGSPE